MENLQQFLITQFGSWTPVSALHKSSKHFGLVMTLSIYTVIDLSSKGSKKIIIPEVNISHLLLSLQDAPGSERLFV